MSLESTATFTLPPWIAPFLAAQPAVFPDDDSRMALVIDLARENVERGSGGPFGAAVFAAGSGELLAAGVNLVMEQQASLAHAEILALLLAQRRLGSHDLAGPGLPACELVTSAQMCAMCCGAVAWSGVRRVVCGARREDVEELLGFDEGPLPADWAAQLAARGIGVRQGVLRERARQVLLRYRDLSGVIYNSRRVTPSP